MLHAEREAGIAYTSPLLKGRLNCALDMRR